MGRRRRSSPLRRALPVAVVAIVLLPVVALAHPLGNFTINHYAGIRIEPERILLDIVIDRAEIPAFQARQDLDTDGDGDVSEAETETARPGACAEQASQLRLAVGEEPAELVLVSAGLSFPPGAGGLSTMRLVCVFEATVRRRQAPRRMSRSPTTRSSTGSVGVRSSSRVRASSSRRWRVSYARQASRSA